MLDLIIAPKYIELQGDKYRLFTRCDVLFARNDVYMDVREEDMEVFLKTIRETDNILCEYSPFENPGGYYVIKRGGMVSDTRQEPPNVMHEQTWRQSFGIIENVTEQVLLIRKLNALLA